MEDPHIEDVIKALPDNMGVQVIFVGEKVAVVPQRIPDFEALNNRAGLFHCICWPQRPGTQMFQTYLEHEYFPPYSPQEAELEYRFLRWKDSLWIVLTIPWDKRQTCYDAATATHMKLSDGIPLIIEDGKEFPFPVRKNVCTVVNLPDSGIYEGAGGRQDEFALERYKVEKYYEEKGLSSDA